MDASPGRFRRLEREGDDFPFYNGEPAALRPLQWWLLMAAVVAAYLILSVPLPYLQGHPATRVALFAIVPLIALRQLVGEHYKALFRRPRPSDVLIAVGFAVLYVVVTFAIGLVFASLTRDTAVNPAVAGVVAADSGGRIVFFLQTVVQLFGEEVLSILPFLALLTWLTAGRGMARRPAIVLAVLGASVLFALAHLPTYGWKLGQVLAILAVARAILFLPYIVTKNLWVSTATHVASDWILFGMAIALSGLVAGAG